MSATDFAPLFSELGVDVTYYQRSFGTADATTGWKEVLWGLGSTVRVIMYPLSKRTEETPDTRGVTEQRWFVISQTKLDKDNRIQRGSEYYIIDTEPASLQVLGSTLVYECEAIREMLASDAPQPTPTTLQTTQPSTVYDYTHSDYSYLVWYDSGRYYAKNGSTGVMTSNANAATLINGLIATLSNGGKIVLKQGSYSVSGTTTLTKRVTVEGEIWGDDVVQGVLITRTSDAPIFIINGVHVTIQNIFMDGDPAYTTPFIDCGTANEYIKLDSLSFLNGACAGIDVDTSFWITINHIRAISITGYAVYGANPGITMININDVIGYASPLISLYGVVGLQIKMCAADYNSFRTNPAIYVSSCSGTIDNCEFEGLNNTTGFGVDSIRQSHGNMEYISNRFLYCGNDAGTALPIRITDTAHATLSNNLFDTTKSWVTVATDVGNYVKLINNVMDKGMNYYMDNSGTGTILTGTTNIQITHGLSYTPAAGDITITRTTVTPTNASYITGVSSIGATYFTVNCNTDPGASGLAFSWAVRKV